VLLIYCHYCSCFGKWHMVGTSDTIILHNGTILICTSLDDLQCAYIIRLSSLWQILDSSVIRALHEDLVCLIKSCTEWKYWMICWFWFGKKILLLWLLPSMSSNSLLLWLLPSMLSNFISDQIVSSVDLRWWDLIYLIKFSME
jgi:hypothetical protein